MNTEAIPAPDSWRMTQHAAPSGKILHIKVESKDRVIFDGFAGNEAHATLAAAAPDLFWALKELLDAVTSKRAEDTSNPIAWSGSPSQNRRMYSAIEKAKSVLPKAL